MVVKHKRIKPAVPGEKSSKSTELGDSSENDREKDFSDFPETPADPSVMISPGTAGNCSGDWEVDVKNSHVLINKAQYLRRLGELGRPESGLKHFSLPPSISVLAYYPTSGSSSSSTSGQVEINKVEITANLSNTGEKIPSVQIPAGVGLFNNTKTKPTNEKVSIDTSEPVKKHVDIIEYTKRNMLKRVKGLIEKGHDVNEKDANGDSAVLWAARNNNLLILQALVEAGADLKHAGAIGITPLGYATYHENFELIEFINERIEDNAPTHTI